MTKWENSGGLNVKNSRQLSCAYCIINGVRDAQIAQSVEQETENLCVVGSIPSLGTTFGIIASEIFQRVL